MLKKELSPKSRNLLVKEVLYQNSSIAQVSRKYGVSRVTAYKWIKRATEETKTKGEPELLNKQRIIERYWHQAPVNHEKAVVSLVEKNPSWGVRTLVKNLPKIGGAPILGHHGVQNVLFRNRLNTFELRMAYANSRQTFFVKMLAQLKGKYAQFTAFSPQERARFISLMAVSFFSLLGTLIFTGSLFYSISISSGVLSTQFVGNLFSLVSLFMGSIFFLYSFKYYLTLAIVLSYSQKPENSGKSIGLQSNLDNVNLEKYPFVSVHIPFFNEKNVVERAIRASTNFNYPGDYEIILCDDSTDETSALITNFQKKHLFKGEHLDTIKNIEEGWTLTSVTIRPGVKLKHLHRSKRDGFKGASLKLALTLVDPRTEYVSVFDADFVPYPDSLELFLKYFQQSSQSDSAFPRVAMHSIPDSNRVAAVQGYQWHVLNKSENWITRGVRSEYSGSYVVERSGTEIYGGLKQISGSVYMIKKNVLEEIGWGTSITEDFELTLKLYEKGYKVLYTPYVQAPAECVSTLRRLIRQRMRWAEGHSFNVKKMFSKLMASPNVTFFEKLELTYLAPYYLQAFFFLVGTFTWLISEVIFKTHLPFWTEVWGWSLILTNMIALPLLNSVGLFLEESEERDYFGLGSFIALSYIVVPFQAYAAVKGFLEKNEGPWFRTPKTGKITDVFARSGLMRFIADVLPKSSVNSIDSKYLELSTANSRFDNFLIKSKRSKFVAPFVTLGMSIVSAFLIYQSHAVSSLGHQENPVVMAKAVRESGGFDFANLFNFISPKEVLSKGFDVNIGPIKDIRIEYFGILSVFGLLVLLNLTLNFVKKHKKLVKIGFTYLIILVISLTNIVSLFRPNRDYSKLSPIEVPPAKAIYQYSPTSGTLVAGSNTTRDSSTAVSAEGMNTGSWQATLADDNLHWMVNGANVVGDNYNVQLNFDGVSLNGANKMIIQTAIDLDAAIAMIVQICDWTSTTSVDSSADSQCTGGGWRTINSQNTSNANVTLTTTTNDTALQWHIYDGYFTTGTTGGSPVTTALTNFISGDSNKRVLLRYYSTTQSSTAIAIDYARVMPIVDSVYHPAGFTQITGGTPTGTYMNAMVVGNTTTAQQNVTSSDNNRLGVPGTAGAISDFYLSYKNVKTYTGANAIYVKAEYSCSTTGVNIKPKIYNFNSSSWEDLTATAITCSATDATNAWALGNVTISNYISSGEIRVGWYGSANNALSIQLDFMYVMIGSVNNDTAQCEASFGTGTATNCSNTRTLDGTTTIAAGAVFQNPAEDESTSFSHDFYARDNDQDATVEEAAASNISMPVTVPTNAQLVGINYASRASGCGANASLSAACGATVMTVQPGLKDYSGFTSTVGGWTQIGGTTGNVTLASTTGYTDTITALSATTPVGLMTNPANYIDTTNNLMNVRLATTASGTSTSNVTANWDFMMTSIAWIEESAPAHPSTRYMFNPTGSNLVTGSNTTITSATAAAASGINMGSWKGTLADDNLHWSVLGSNQASATNYDVQLNVDNVQLNGANKMMIQTEVDLDAAIAMVVQICDWVSTTSVDNSADAQCTGGGWRTLNSQNASNANVALTTVTTPPSLQWHIYDGYFTTGTTGGSAVSTPLTNFISNDSNRRVKIRYFSTTQSATAIDIDYLRITNIVDSVYHPASFTQITGGTPAGTYANTHVVGNTTTAQQTTTTADGVYLSVPGTAGAISDFYLSFKNVETYTGANTIYVKADYSCDNASGPSYKPKIYNFNSTSWEDLTATAITCSTTDATNAWALNNVTVSNYISGGEIRVGWYGASNSTFAIRIDLMYIILGTTNTDTAQCEASFGTGTATNCSNTRTLDGTTTIAAGAVFQNPAEDESTTFGHDFYARDNDQDGTLEEASASNVGFSVTVPTNAQVVGLNYASRASGCGANASLSAACGATVMTVQPGFRDYSGLTSTVGGWTQVGTATGNITLASGTGYSDTIISLAATLPMGVMNNAEDYVDTVGNEVNMRLATTASGTSTTNVTANWDFAMVSMSWIYASPQYELSDYRFFANLDQSPPDVGSALSNQNTSATAPSQGTAFRLRVLLRNYGEDEAVSGGNFKLQIAQRGADNLCDTSFTNETYSDLSPSSGAIRFYDNTNLSDGANITSDNANDPVNSLYTNVRQTYEESNNFSNSQNIIRTDQTGRWDFALVDFSATQDTTYCIRIVKSDSTPLDTYTIIPQFTTVPENPILFLSFIPFLFAIIKRNKKE